MKACFVRRRWMGAGLTVATLGLTACEDSRVKALQAGITRDSAVTILAKDMKGGGGPDAFPNVYDRGQYLIAGTNYEVLYYSKNNEKKKNSSDSASYSKYTPVVFKDNRLIAKGWPAWDSISLANKIPLKNHKG